MAETIERSRVNPVEAVIQRSVNCRNGVVLVLRPHASVPATSTNRPRADSEGSDVEVATSKLPFFHWQSVLGADLGRITPNHEIACSGSHNEVPTHQKKSRAETTKQQGRVQL